jgi:hypothetical protein
MMTRGFDDVDVEMAREYQGRIDAMGPDPTAEQIAAEKEWARTHDWRAYHVAWRVVKAMNGGVIP